MKPRIVVSKCLGFAAVRYDGLKLADDFVDRLRGHVVFLPVCPEVELGLGVPRDPIRLVVAGGCTRLIQPATGADLTASMASFASGFLDGLGDVDGFILKSRSPSCGVGDVKRYRSAEAERGRSGGTGGFASVVLERYPLVAVEDEARLCNRAHRERFLVRVFASARFRELARRPTPAGLAVFHKAHRRLVGVQDARRLRELDGVVANRARRPLRAVLTEYGNGLMRALARPPGRTRSPLARLLREPYPPELEERRAIPRGYAQPS